MENISCLKNSCNREDVYVVATGKSSEYIDANFFNDKISIGVNFVYNLFPNLTYYLCKEGSVIDFLKDKDVCIVASEYDCGNKEGPKNYGANYFFYHDQNVHTTFNENLDTSESLIVSWSTITSAIHFAYFLGAKNIILVGHDCGDLDNARHISGYVQGGAYTDNWLLKIEPQTVRLKHLLRERGVNVYSLNPFINFGLEGHTYTR